MLLIIHKIQVEFKKALIFWVEAPRLPPGALPLDPAGGRTPWSPACPF